MTQHRAGWMRDYLQKRKARGVCPSCGKLYDGPRYRCRDCRIHRAQLKQERKAA